MTLNEGYEDMLEGLLLATARQLAAGELLQARLRKLNSLLQFVEDELEDADVDSPYLNQAFQSMEKMLAMDVHSAPLNEHFEKISVEQLFTGVAERLNRLSGRRIFDSDELLESGLMRGEINTLSRALLVLLRQFEERTDLILLQRLLKQPQSLEEDVSSNSLREYLLVGNDSGGAWQALIESPDFIGNLEVSEQMRESYGLLQLHGVGVYISLDGQALLFSLPVVGSPDIQGELDADLFESELRGSKTILVVDDEDMIWDVLIEHLQGLGYMVLLAGNGVEAVEIYKENPGVIDLVILDVIMPEMNGREALKLIMEIDPQACVLISSGYVGDTEAAELLKMGASSFLKKPYRMKELALRVKQLTGE